MKFPTLNETSMSRDMVDTFRGYNHNLRIGGGEFYDMTNMTSSYYPILSPRNRRGEYATPTSTKGMIAKDTLCYVNGSHFLFDEYDIDMSLSDTPKQLVSMGAYVIILPDKKYINTKDVSDWGSLEAEYSSGDQNATVSYDVCTLDGEGMSITYKQANDPTVGADGKPVAVANGSFWIDQSSTPHVLKQYSAASAVWVDVPTTYVKISAKNIALDIKEGDGVTISGIKDTITQLTGLNGQTSIVWKAFRDEGNTEAGREAGTYDYIVVIGILDESKTQTVEEGSLLVQRLVPDMDFVIESENRLWGCKYGVVNGEMVNEIYASKLGDFRNWSCFMGLSTDSYRASCGTDGAWTGAITHLGYPLFFKETCLHKVYGNYPSNYQIQTTACRGVQRGSGNSLAIVNEVLYYKSRNGVCAYDGSLPVEVSANLGEERYSDAVAGANGNKYYISMKDSAGKYNLFVFDTSKGMWHKEDDMRADSFCFCRGELYYIDNADKAIKTINGSGKQDVSPVEWMAETGVYGTDSPDKKYISRLVVRLSLDIGSRVYFYIQYDSMGGWEHVSTIAGTSLMSVSVPIRPKRCDHFRLRIVGEGDAKIYSITKTIEDGSDRG